GCRKLESHMAQSPIRAIPPTRLIVAGGKGQPHDPPPMSRADYQRADRESRSRLLLLRKTLREQIYGGPPYAFRWPLAFPRPRLLLGCGLGATWVNLLTARWFPVRREKKNEEPYPCFPLWFGGKRDRGEPHMLNVSIRPQSAVVAAVSAIAATAGETSSDEILVDRIAAGNKLAMQALFARHRTYGYRWLLRFVSNETLAEDLLSEVFLDVWRQAGRF